MLDSACLQPGAYLSCGADLFEVVQVGAVFVELEDCRTFKHTSPSRIVVRESYDLVRAAPTPPDHLPAVDQPKEHQ